MTSVQIHAEPFPLFKASDRSRVIACHEGLHIIRIPKGTQQGNSTVAVAVKLPDGRGIWLEMTMNNFLMAADAMRGFEAYDKIPKENN